MAHEIAHQEQSENMASRPKARLSRLSSIFWVASVVFAAVYVKMAFANYNDGGESDFSFQMKLFSALMSVMFCLLAIFCKDLADRDPAASHTLSSLLRQYFLLVVLSKVGRIFYNRFLNSTKNIASTQEKYLMKLLKNNAETEYGKANGFAQMNSMAEFRMKHPVTTYGDIETYIDKICSSNRNALTKSDPMFMNRTSGTTGKYKKIPVSGDTQKSFVKLVPLLFYLPQLKGVQQNLQKQFALPVQPKIESTATGLKVAPLSYFHYRHSPSMVSPKSADDITDERSAYYIHALFGLAERDIGSFIMGFTHQCCAFFTFLENNIESLCSDLENGTICDGLNIEEHIYETLRDVMKSDQLRADEVHREFQKGKIGLAKRLWPGLVSLRSISTGSMQIYTTYLLESYLKDVTVLSNVFGGSEGMYGLSLTKDPRDPRYTLTHQLGFYEFLPEQYISDSDVKDKLVLAHLVEVDHNYELVLTNQNGLYRYRTGDVVHVKSFLNQCPEMEVLYRSGQVVNVQGERLTEDLLTDALVKTSGDLGCHLMDYTVCEDVYFFGMNALRGTARQYVLFIETDKKLKPEDLEKFDSTLCDLSEVYHRQRFVRKTMDAMHITQVKPSTFIQLKNQMTKGASNPQFKIPRTLRVKEHLEFLMENKW